MALLFFFHTNVNYLVGLRLPMLAALADAGYLVKAFAPDMNDKAANELRRHGIDVGRLPLDAAGLNPIRDVRNMFALARLLRKDRPDIVFTNNIKPVAFGTIAAALAGVPRRYALVGGLGYAFTNTPGARVGYGRSAMQLIASLLYAVSFRLCKFVIFHNLDDRALLVKRRICPPNVAVVVSGSGVDTQRFVPAKLPNVPTFIFVGRLLADKGVREYLEAARSTKTRFPEARFLLVGDVDANPSAIKLEDVLAYTKTGDVEWKGKVDDVRPFLLESSVFVLPSYREGVPRSTLEAMACGLAVITTDAPGCRETVVPGRNGFLVPVGDAGALSDAMCALCSESTLVVKMGGESRLIAVERFSVDKINKDILRLLKGALPA